MTRTPSQILQTRIEKLENQIADAYEEGYEHEVDRLLDLVLPLYELRSVGPPAAAA